MQERKSPNDGLTTTYDAEVKKLLGSQEPFFKSIFSEENRDKISDLTQGDKKEPFVQMLGLEWYWRYAENAKEKTRQLKAGLYP